jgi:hypothetical protein
VPPSSLSPFNATLALAFVPFRTHLCHSALICAIPHSHLCHSDAAEIINSIPLQV